MTKKRLGLITAIIALVVFSLGIVGCGSTKSAADTTKVEDSSLSAKQDASLVNVENTTKNNNEEVKSEENKAETSKKEESNNQVAANNAAPVNNTVNESAPQVVDVTPAAPVTPEAQRVLDLTNAERANAGLNGLVYDGTLTAIANVRAQEIVEKWAHVRPDGTNITTLAGEYGYSYRVLGENLAKGQTSPEQAVAEWMASEGHKANILGAKYSKIGIGVFSSNGKLYWVQIFSD